MVIKKLATIVATSIFAASTLVAAESDIIQAAVASVNDGTAEIKGYYLDDPDAGWFYVDLSANNTIYWWGNSTDKEVYAGVVGTATPASSNSQVTFGELTADADCAASDACTASVDFFNNAEKEDISGYFIQTTAVDDGNLPVWIYYDVTGATPVAYQYENGQAGYQYEDVTSLITSTIDVANSTITAEGSGENFEPTDSFPEGTTTEETPPFPF